MNPVVVIGIPHHNTLGVIRALGRKGLSSSMYPVIAGKSGNYVSKSRYIVRSNMTLIDDLTDLIGALEHLEFPTAEKAIVISCWDAAISLLDEHRMQLEKKYIIPSATGEYGSIHTLMSKELQIKAAVDAGIDVPTGVYYSKLDSDNNILHEWNDFPCIIKPADSIVGTKTEIHICKDKNDLLNDLETSHCNYFFIQKYIEKSMEFQLIGCSLSGGKEVIIPGYTDIIRQPSNTNTGFLKYSPISDGVITNSTIERVGQFIKNIGYSGLFSVEFLKGDDGKDYFLEINMRNDGNAICVTDAGVNLPFIWYAYNAGLDYKEEASKRCVSLFCMPEFDDIIFVLKGQLSVTKWVKDINRTRSFMEYSKDDKRPFYCRLRDFLLFLTKRTFQIK